MTEIEKFAWRCPAAAVPPLAGLLAMLDTLRGEAGTVFSVSWNYEAADDNLDLEASDNGTAWLHLYRGDGSGGDGEEDEIDLSWDDVPEFVGCLLSGRPPGAG